MKKSAAEKAARTRARNALARERAALERFARWRAERIHWERERERIRALPPAMRVGVKLAPPPPPFGAKRPPVVVVPEPSYQPPGGPPGSAPVPLQGAPIQGEGDTLTLAVLRWWQDWTRTTLHAMGRAPVVSIQAPDGSTLQVPEEVAKGGPGAVLAWVKAQAGELAKANGAWTATTTGTQKKATPPKGAKVGDVKTELQQAQEAGAEEARQEALLGGMRVSGPASEEARQEYLRREAELREEVRRERAYQQVEGPLPGQPDNDDEGGEDEDDEA